MSKFVLAYRGGSVPESPEQQEAVMSAWTSWFGELAAAVIDGGNPFGDAKTIASDGSVTDGGAASLGGYSVIDASDLDDAVSKARGCPILDAGGSVEVYLAMDM